MVTAVQPCVSCVNFRGCFLFHSVLHGRESSGFRTTTMADICQKPFDMGTFFDISVNLPIYAVTNSDRKFHQVD